MSLSKNTTALICCGILVFGFLFAGIFDVLDYIIVKVLLFTGFGIFVSIVAWSTIKNSENKKSP